MPPWANGSAYEFITKMRTYLESDEVSEFINEWIDLIFGFKQRGKEAENALNLYIPSSYDDNINIDAIDKDQKPYYLRMVEFGLTPAQITTKPFTKKLFKNYVRKGKQITESKELKAFGNTGITKHPKFKDKPMMLKMKVLDNDKVICVYSNNTYNICKFTPNDHKYSIDIVSKTYSVNDVFKMTNRISEYYTENLINSPVVIYNNGKVNIYHYLKNQFNIQIIAQAGYWNGAIAVCYSEGNIMKKYYYKTSQFPITCLVLDKSEKYAFAGNIKIYVNNKLRIYNWNFIYFYCQ